MPKTVVGRVRKLFIYPVKSMRGIAVPEISCYWYGANGDRKAAFTRAGDLSGFPWLTARELPDLLTYEPYFVDATSPLTSATHVRTPDGRDLPLESSALSADLARRHGAAIALLKLKRGTFDCMPMSLITTSMLDALRQAAGRTLDVRRFRPNILIEGLDGENEEAWAGSILAFGERDDAARLQVNYPTKRCMMINLDPDSAESDERILKAAAASNEANAGVYAAVSRPGAIRVGDAVYLDVSG
jgi:uncharacterized protein